MALMTTSADLVADLGLSKTAISQILNGKGRYAEATRERVLARARELGYSPHAGARAARLQRFETLVLFNTASFWEGLPHPGIYEGCMEGVAAEGYRLLLETVSSEGMPSLAQRSTLLGQRNCDGLLMNYHLPPPPELRQLVEACGVPVMWLNVQLERNCIHPDDRGAALALVRAMLARDRRRLAWLDFLHDYGDDAVDGHYSVGERYRAAGAAAADAGRELRRLTPRIGGFEQRLAYLRVLLARDDRPDGIICYHTTDTQVLLLALAEAGLRPGRDVGVAQFHERPDVVGRPVATALIPFKAMGVAASASLIAAAQAGEHELPATSVPFTFDFAETL